MVRIPIREYMKIGTGSDQWNRNEISIKTSSTGKVKDIREANTKINLTFGYTMLMFIEKHHHL